MVLKEIRRKAMNWAYLAQDRDEYQTSVNSVMNFRVP
jgi:hypothetical protein